jgi:hypothetical protein
MTFDPVFGRAIALAYDELEGCGLAARRSYAAMARDEWKQFRAAIRYIQINIWRGEGQPYANSAAMRQDVLQRRHLWVFAGGNPHPCRSFMETIRGRAVHDIFAHAARGHSFSADGELAAFIASARLYSPEALPALASDNLGPTAYYYFHPVNAGKPHAARVWPTQKAELLPGYLWRHFLE